MAYRNRGGAPHFSALASFVMKSENENDASKTPLMMLILKGAIGHDVLHVLKAGEVGDINAYDNGANVHARDRKLHRTPLHLAGGFGLLDIIRFLTVLAGANPNLTDDEGNTPLHCAAEKGHAEGCALLVKAFADVRKKNHIGRTPLHVAVVNSQRRVVDALCRVSVLSSPVNVKNFEGDTPLHLALRIGNEGIVKDLLEIGWANVSIKNNDMVIPKELVRSGKMRTIFVKGRLRSVISQVCFHRKLANLKRMRLDEKYQKILEWVFDRVTKVPEYSSRQRSILLCATARWMRDTAPHYVTFTSLQKYVARVKRMDSLKESAISHWKKRILHGTFRPWKVYHRVEKRHRVEEAARKEVQDAQLSRSRVKQSIMERKGVFKSKKGERAVTSAVQFAGKLKQLEKTAETDMSPKSSPRKKVGIRSPEGLPPEKEALELKKMDEIFDSAMKNAERRHTMLVSLESDPPVDVPPSPTKPPDGQFHRKALFEVTMVGDVRDHDEQRFTDVITKAIHIPKSHLRVLRVDLMSDEGRDAIVVTAKLLASDSRSADVLVEELQRKNALNDHSLKSLRILYISHITDELKRQTLLERTMSVLSRSTGNSEMKGQEFLGVVVEGDAISNRPSLRSGNIHTRDRIERSPGEWTSIQIYVSSSGPDTVSEIDYLRKFVFPALKELCLTRCVHFGAVDLRWRSQSGEQPVIQTAFEGIDMCKIADRRFFMSIMDRKLGPTIPPKDWSRLLVHPRHAWVRTGTAERYKKLEKLRRKKERDTKLRKSDSEFIPDPKDFRSMTLMELEIEESVFRPMHQQDENSSSHRRRKRVRGVESMFFSRNPAFSQTINMTKAVSKHPHLKTDPDNHIEVVVIDDLKQKLRDLAMTDNSVHMSNPNSPRGFSGNATFNLARRGSDVESVMSDVTLNSTGTQDLGMGRTLEVVHGVCKSPRLGPFLSSRSDKGTIGVCSVQFSDAYPCRFNGVRSDGEMDLRGLEEFGLRVFNGVWDVVQDYFQHPSKASSPQEVHRAKMERLVADAEEGDTIARESVIRQLRAAGTRGVRQPVIIAGEEGSGRSSMLTSFAKLTKSEDPDLNVIFYSVGAFGGSQDTVVMLRYLCTELVKVLHTSPYYDEATGQVILPDQPTDIRSGSSVGKSRPESRMTDLSISSGALSPRPNQISSEEVIASSPRSPVADLVKGVLWAQKESAKVHIFSFQLNDLIEVFQHTLHEISRACLKVMVIINGSEMLTDRDCWIPKTLPFGISLLVSKVMKKSEFFKLRNNERLDAGLLNNDPSVDKYVFLGDLPDQEKEAIFAAILTSGGKCSLSREEIYQVGREVLVREDARLPSYVKICALELRRYPLFEESLERAKRFPESVHELAATLIAKLERTHGQTLTQTALSFICISRQGLVDLELRDLLGENDYPLPDSVWIPFFASLQPLIKPIHWGFQEAVIEFGDVSIVREVEKRYKLLNMSEDDGENSPKPKFSSHSKSGVVQLHRQMAVYFRKCIDSGNRGLYRRLYPRGFAEICYHQTKGQMWAEVTSTCSNLFFLENSVKLMLMTNVVYTLSQCMDVLSASWRDFHLAENSQSAFGPKINFKHTLAVMKEVKAFLETYETSILEDPDQIFVLAMKSDFSKMKHSVFECFAAYTHELNETQRIYVENSSWCDSHLIRYIVERISLNQYRAMNNALSFSTEGIVLRQVHTDFLNGLRDRFGDDPIVRALFSAQAAPSSMSFNIVGPDNSESPTQSESDFVHRLSVVLEEVQMEGRLCGVAIGKSHVLVLQDEHTLICIGQNLHGCLGQNLEATTKWSLEPLLIGSEERPANVVRVACTDYVSGCVTSDGKLYVWGEGSSSCLGQNDRRSRFKPSRVALGLAGKIVKEVAFGKQHAVCVTDEGEAYSWGEGVHGQLGHLDDTTPKLFPRHIVGTGNSSEQHQTSVKSVACGETVTAFLSNDGKAYWTGELARGGESCSRPQPVTPSGSNISNEYMNSVSCGAKVLAMTAKSGCMFVWDGGDIVRVQHSERICSVVFKGEKMLLATDDGYIHERGLEENDELSPIAMDLPSLRGVGDLVTEMTSNSEIVLCATYEAV